MPEQIAHHRRSGIGCLSAIVAIVLVYGYFRADNMGWIPHRRKAVVVAPPTGWPLNGESVSCIAVIPSLLGISLNCSGNNQNQTDMREESVTFWGIVGSTPRVFHCVRENDAVSCHRAD